MDTPTGPETDPAGLRQRQVADRPRLGLVESTAETTTSDTNEPQKEDIRHEMKPKKTFGRTPDGTGKVFCREVKLRN